MPMRPKSIATVVVVLASTPSIGSESTPASVSISSVDSGRISLTAPTRVVLPTPNPPATRILMAVGTDVLWVMGENLRLERPQAVDDGGEDVVGGQVAHRLGFVDRDRVAFEQVGQEYADDAERQVDVRGDLGDGDRTVGVG